MGVKRLGTAQAAWARAHIVPPAPKPWRAPNLCAVRDAASAQQLPAVDSDRLPGDPVRVRRCQEQRDLGHFFRRAHTAEWNALQHALVEGIAGLLALVPHTAFELDRAR